MLNNIKDNNYSISTAHNLAFSEIRKYLEQIQQLLGIVHVDDNTINNLQIEIEDLNDIAEDLSAGLVPLHLKVNITEEKLTETKDAFDELHKKFNELHGLLNELKGEEEDLKQGSIDGALNITRESLERLKKAQQTMTETHDILKEISLACKNLASIPFNYENITSGTNDQLNITQTILNELLTNYTHFNAKMCQVVNVTCQVQNCSDIFCMFKVDKNLKEKVELLGNALKEIKNKEKEFDHMKETLKKLQDEYRQAKTRKEESVLEVKAKLAAFNSTESNFNKTMDKLNKLRNISNLIDEAKENSQKVLEINFLEDDDYLKELITKISDALKNITDADEIVKQAANDESKANELLIKAMKARYLCI